MKHAPIVALALAGALVAGCGGGGGNKVSEETHAALQQELEDAQEAQRQAEEEKRRAEEERRLAEEAKRLAEEEKRLAEEAKRLAEEEKRLAEQAQQQAEQQRQQEQEARQEAEARADDLEEEAGNTANQLVQANARQVYAGLEGYITDGTEAGDASPTVTPRYRESALVTTSPVVTFTSTTTGTLGNWFRTSLSNRAFDFSNRLHVYSDNEAPEQVSFRESVYNDGVNGGDIPNTSKIDVAYLYDPSNAAGTPPAAVIDSAGDVVGSLGMNGATVSGVVSSPFPRSGEGAKSFTLVDRGKYTTDQRRLSQLDPGDPDRLDPATLLNDDGTPYTGRYRDGERYPLRWNYEASGSLAGASGTFTCASDMMPAADACRVTNQNTHFLFTGPWVFTPSAGARVRVDDAEFMYFGWWARQDNSDGSWMYRTFHGPVGSGTAGNRSSAAEIAQLSGTATYQGSAVGQYSFYEPLSSNSEYGEFTARATLTANFTAVGDGGDETVHGTIDQFNGHPDWTLTLKQRLIASGVIGTGKTDAVNAVSWSIAGEATAAPDSGTWEAAFYSNLPADKRGGSNGVDTEDATPTGIAGTFEAEYHHVGKIIGAFGAHKQP